MTARSLRIARKPAGYARRCCGWLVLTVHRDGLLQLPAHTRLGLAPGDILALRKVSESFLRIASLRDFCSYPWHEHQPALRHGYLARLFSCPLTHVSADAVLPVPWDLCPLPAGERVVLFAMDRKTRHVLYLAKADRVR